MATEASASQPVDLTSVVAKHYNQLEEKGLEERAKSLIFHMRNFNNWIKSMLIGEFLEKVKSSEGNRRERRIHVLDIGAGKGGDLLKWKKGNIHHLVCADIAETSVEQCQERYKEMQERDRRQRYHDSSTFTLECIAADCTKVRLKDRYKDSNQMFDIVSCQFSFHYCFESLTQAQCMIKNASECLKPGGFFIGTTPDAFDIIRRLRDSDSLSFGNDVFSATFKSKDDIPLFGAQYAFHLEGVVDCPEFLVYFPAFIELASQFGLKLIYKKRFEEFFEDNVKSHDGRQLLTRMQALQTYPEHSHNSDRSKDRSEHKFKEPRNDRSKESLKAKDDSSMDLSEDKSKESSKEESQDDSLIDLSDEKAKKTCNDKPKDLGDEKTKESSEEKSCDDKTNEEDKKPSEQKSSSDKKSEVFKHADKYLEEQKLKDAEADSEHHRRDSRWPPKLGTLSQTEWEAVSIYVVYAFVKEDTNKDSP